MNTWDTSLLPKSEQFEFYHDVICRAFVPLLPIPVGERLGFASTVETRELGEVNRARIASPQQATHHGPAEVSATEAPYYFVNLQLAGRCAVRQGRTESVVSPGEFTVIDTTEPFYLDFDADWRMLSFRVPHEMLDERMRGVSVELGAAIGASGAGAAAIALLTSLWQIESPLSHAASFDLSLALAASVAGALSDRPAPMDDISNAGLRPLVLRYLERHLADPNLSVASVSHAFALSPRTLHSLFENETQTFAATLREMRMQRAAQLLRGGSLSVTAVGEAVGYPEPSSFGRAFRRIHGLPPGALLP